MIISHKLKVIYIKLGKVAGTSFEIALSKYCGADDIITPIVDEDEATRQSLRFCGPQNYIDLDTRKPKFRHHTPARDLEHLITADIWNSYLKIASIRCPYDMFVSHYHEATRIDRRSGNAFEQFVATNHLVLEHVYGLHIEGKIAADFLIRYEHLIEDIKILESKINCPGLLQTFQGITAKGHYRPKTGTASYEMYFKYPDAKKILDEQCSKDASKYEFFQKYWPMYKVELEKAIAHYESHLSWFHRFIATIRNKLRRLHTHKD